MKILDYTWTNTPNVAVQIMEPTEEKPNDRMLRIVRYEGVEMTVLAEARMSQASWVKMFPVLGAGTYDALLCDVRQQVKDAGIQIPSVEDSPFTQIKEAVEAIRDTARTSLKTDDYPTEEAWMRSNLSEISWRSDQLLKTLQ